jgi:hypothetical protein
MNVTREVITDLLPLYFSGDASPNTRALVEEFFRNDPEFAEEAKDQLSLPDTFAPTIDQEAEMQAFTRTKRFLRNRTIFLAAAIFFSLLPFSVMGREGHVYWAWRELPQLALAAAVIGLAAWCGYAWSWYRVRSSGL